MTHPRVAFLAVDTQWVDPSGTHVSFSYAARKLEASVRTELERLVVETHSAELMRRFARWMPAADRARLRASIRVPEVMGA